MRLKFTGIFSLLLLCVFNLCQAQNDPNHSTNQLTYKVFDPSKSLPGNESHDKMHFLISNSEEVNLPADVLAFLDSNMSNDEIGPKLKSAQTAWLRVLYNPQIRKEDKMFVYEKLQAKSGQHVEAILPFFQNYLKK